MPGIALLVIILLVLVFGGLIFAYITGRLNERRRERVGDKDLGVEESIDRPVHRRVANEEQPRLQ